MATRKLVNGSPGLADSLTFRNGKVPAALAAAYDLGGYVLVTLDQPPLSVNVRVGSKGGAERPTLWHGVLTDYKLRGHTIPKLILSIATRPVSTPCLKLCDFYVLVPRVRSFDGLRLLQRDKAALEKATEIQHDEYLAAWEHSYDSEA